MILKAIKLGLLYMIYFILGLWWIMGASYIILGEYESGYSLLFITAILTGILVWIRMR